MSPRRRKQTNRQYAPPAKRSAADIVLRAFYDGPEWRDLSRLYLAEHPTCENPECPAHVAGITEPATQVHHRTSVRADFGRRLDPTNLMALSARCHNALEKRRARA